MNKEEIDRIMEELKDRTAWGVSLDAISLSLAKRDAEHLIRLIDDALSDIETFARDNIPDPKTEAIE